MSSEPRIIASYTDFDNRTIEIREAWMTHDDGSREVVIEEWLEGEYAQTLTARLINLP